MDLGKFNKDRQKRKIDLSTMVYGKVPPQAKDLEEAVLGAIMLDKSGMDRVSTILKSNSFYVESHQRIYACCQAMYDRNMPIDVLTVVEELKRREELDLVGGPYFVTKLTNSVVSAVNIESHAKIIQQKFIQREVIRVAGEAISEAYEDSTDAFDLIDQVEENILSIGRNNIQDDMVHISSLAKKGLENIEHYRTLEHHVTGVPTGFPTLDRATRGWQTGLVIIGARPSVGKTATALQIAKNAASNSLKPVTVLNFSLEMKAVSQFIRMLAAESEIYLTRLQTGRLEEQQVKQMYESAQSLAKLPIWFDDGFGLSLLSLKAKCRRMKKKLEKTKHPVGLVIIDYLQLMSGSDSRRNREQEISSISRGLKLLSAELDVPVVALSQLTRESEGKEEPQLKDLRESGAIEQDADLVMLIWGPSDKQVQEDVGLTNRRYFKIAKQRDGVLVKVNVEFNTAIQKISEYVEQKQPPAELGPGSWKPVVENEIPFK